MRPAANANPDSLRDRTHRQEPLQHPLDALFLVVIFELFLFDEPGYVFYLFPRSSVYVRKDHRITRSPDQTLSCVGSSHEEEWCGKES
jgi:hypothetical protein